ncbi:hypothetical protein SAMN05421509_107264 [Chromohalobacter canadensis]|uniref:Phage abortive infection protein n=1 Tax=Chromohalobacter canadensis TaxID=141389 RepID=A0A285VSF3_9GAMM|nr:hypothetical protein [Chromohalobacter canadensis]SOC56797.1 hypothetical protein SAMN05421509_107264 [Chromohalobacter canadensis]
MNRYVVFASASIILVALFYFVNFYVKLGFRVSSDVSDWAALGDYMGGLLGPLLNFITIFILVKSLVFQKNSNEELKAEIEDNKKIGRLRSFENLFFNMLEAQNNIFDDLTLDVEVGGQLTVYKNADAVAVLEENIEDLRDAVISIEEIGKYLEDIDSADKLFGMLRSFYITVRIISEKLSNKEGFDFQDRESHFLTLINFTNFSHLRLVMLMVQFLECYPSSYLKEHEEFEGVLKKVGLSMKLY